VRGAPLSVVGKAACSAAVIFACEQRQRVAVPPERQFRGPAKNKIKGISDMKKIKTKLVTFVTDNVRLVGIVGNKNLLARMSQDKEQPHRESKRKRWRCDNSEGTARTCDGSATTG